MLCSEKHLDKFPELLGPVDCSKATNAYLHIATLGKFRKDHKCYKREQENTFITKN